MPDLGEILRSHAIADSSLQPLNDADSYYLEVPGAEAIGRWSALRNIFDETRYWPVVLGGGEELAHHKQALAQPQWPNSEQILPDPRPLRRQPFLPRRPPLFPPVP